MGNDIIEGCLHVLWCFGIPYVSAVIRGAFWDGLHHDGASMTTMQRWVAGVVVGGAMALAGAGLLRGVVAGAEPARPADAAQRLDVLVAGLRARQQALVCLRATAVVTSLFAEAQWRVLLDAAEVQKRKAAGTLPDREMALLRFATDERRHRLEGQVLLSAGGYRDRIPFNPKADPEECRRIGGLYFRELCDGEHAYLSHGSVNRAPSITRVPASAPSANGFRTELGCWIGASPHLPGLGQKDADMRVIGVEQTKLGDEDAYLVHLARARSAEVDEVKCWIAPGKGYAVVRQEVLVLLERFPQAGARSIEKWEDFAFVGDVWVPQTYEKTHYRYTARAGTPTALWDATDRTVLWDIRLGEPVSFSLLDDPVPLGAMPQGVAATEGVSPQEMDSLRQQCMRPWSYWAGFIKAPRPTPDPQFMQPLTGKEIADLKTALGAKP